MEGGFGLEWPSGFWGSGIRTFAVQGEIYQNLPVALRLFKDRYRNLFVLPSCTFCLCTNAVRVASICLCRELFICASCTVRQCTSM